MNPNLATVFAKQKSTVGMNSVNKVRKVKKLNRRGKLINTSNQPLDPIEEKKQLVAALMVKCDKTEEEVLEAYDEFYLKHEDGFIGKDEFTNSLQAKVTEDQLT